MKSVLAVTLLCTIVIAVSGQSQKPTEEPQKCRNYESPMDCIIRVNMEAKEAAENSTDGAFSIMKKIELYEGDIVWTKRLKADIAEQKIRAENGMGAFDAANRGRWPNARVPYKFASNFGYKGVVYQAIADYNKKTCVRLVPHTPAEERKAGGYIYFMHGGGCYSQIGRVGGKQDVSLGSGCNYKGTAIHEIMHALGFYHEQSRLDRDSYIRIMWNNIPRAMWFNFQKYRQGAATTHNEPYDKKSLMHYGNYAFSNNRQMTIVSLSNRNERLGTQFGPDGLSRIDTNQLNKHYSCGKTTTVVTKRPITTTCKNVYPFCTALSGWCKNQFVKTNCKKTCNLCKTTVVTPRPKRCVDKSQHCPAWARQNYCRPGGNAWVRKNCKKSCRTC